ncbi:hypothetical protein OB69_14910 [Roseivirga seohaensis subsp. aquiponti]|uniref:DUF2019 domain-containing protein n=1 Tax=Roseivirga seohaensis subsp. aquiponti TaxID=1566026 RepID=A0A0L8AI00_9BACT|nr:hypothetical protein [Roseivirga seohaensis]KOF02013.1 hypothetical protein OB69_14910 [Roseivirga seohaensis subsp. aquiponti]
MDKLITDYIELATNHVELLFDGDSKKANKIHKKLMDIVLKIRKDKSLHGLYFDLLENKIITVRMWTAVEFSNTFEEKALRKLIEIEKLDSILSLTAYSLIDSIKKGMIKKVNWIDE